MFPSVDDHPELGAPVADVIVPGDFVAEKLGDPRQGVAEDGAADVADMHRLGDVRRAEVDYDPARSFGARNAEPVVLQAEEEGDFAVLPLDDDVLDLLLERNPAFIEECRQIRERMRQGDYVTYEAALEMFRQD